MDNRSFLLCSSSKCWRGMQILWATLESQGSHLPIMTAGYFNTAHGLLLAPTAATKFGDEACRMCVTRLSFCSRSARAFLHDIVQRMPDAYAEGVTGICLSLQQ